MKQPDHTRANDEESVQSRLDALCDHFEQQWKSGQVPLIEDFLKKIPADEQPSLFGDLLGLELDYLRKTEETPLRPDYERRFPKFADAIEMAFAEIQKSPADDPYGQTSISSVDGTLDATQLGEHGPGDADNEVIPTSLGPYSIEKLIGQGAFGSVYLGRKGPEEAAVAIKVLRDASSSNPELREQFNREADALEEVAHPAIVGFVDRFVTEDGTLALAIEYIPGGTLKERLREPRSHREIAEFVAVLAEGLHQLHLSGVTHRDVKPENILLDKDGRPKLADVGLALPDHAYGQGQQTVAGSLAYMSPEQARGDSHLVDGRADIYGLGVVMYEMLTGRRPFRADSSDELLRRIQTISIKPPRQIDGSIPQALEKVCLKATTKDPAERYSTGADFASELRKASVAADHPSNRLRTRSIVIAVLLLITTGVGIWLADGEIAPTYADELSVVQFDVQVSRERSELLPLDRYDALKMGDGFRVFVELSKPAYAKLLWVDPKGTVVEFYPPQPETDESEPPEPVRTFSSPAVPDVTWTLDAPPAGFSESLFLLVNESPIPDISLPESGVEVVNDPQLEEVLRYRALRTEAPRLLTKKGHDLRGSFTGKKQKIIDPTLQLMEQMRNQVDEVHVVRIPMQYSAP
ncbi:MAG: protein kinase [Fuerstiella sp.]